MGNISAFVLRRGVQIVPTLFGLLILVFLLARVVPGDPVRLALGPEASASQIAAYRTQLGLDDPLLVQFFNYIWGLLHGQFGQSIQTQRDVANDIAAFLPATLELVFLAMLISIVVGVPLGVLSASRRNTTLDHVTRLVSLAGVAMPRFWLAILLQLGLAYALTWFPLTGRSEVPFDRITGFVTVDSLLKGNTKAFADGLWHLCLPALALSLPTMAQVMRLTRTSMIEVLKKPFIQVHRAYGISNNKVIWKFGLRNGLTLILTLLGLSFASLLENAFLIEVVFAWPGISSYGAKAVIAKDFNAVIAVTLIIGLSFMLVNLFVDLLYGLFDPRIRYD